MKRSSLSTAPPRWSPLTDRYDACASRKRRRASSDVGTAEQCSKKLRACAKPKRSIRWLPGLVYSYNNDVVAETPTVDDAWQPSQPAEPLFKSLGLDDLLSREQTGASAPSSPGNVDDDDESSSPAASPPVPCQDAIVPPT